LPTYFTASNSPGSRVTRWTRTTLWLLSDILLNIEFWLIWVSTFSEFQLPAKKEIASINIGCKERVSTSIQNQKRNVTLAILLYWMWYSRLKSILLCGNFYSLIFVTLYNNNALHLNTVSFDVCWTNLILDKYIK
jgi:hypothetical protein